MTRQPANLVITGTYRSGTTFVERLVDNSDDGYCAPQPFPYLYLAAKRLFLRRTNHAVPQYPIGSGFHDPSHQPHELAAFLESEVIDRDTIDEAFRSMQRYSGAQTAELADIVADLPEGTLTEIVVAMQERLARARGRSASLLASKEIVVEEFVPAFGLAGIHVLLVVRDPRRVAASTFGPASSAWTGRPRPLLYTVRLWRKSVAYALRYRSSIAFARLEDFVAKPTSTLQACFDALGIPSQVRVPEPLLDAQGHVWQPNTSFPADAGACAPFGLSDRQLAYVEALALPEMRLLGYQPVTDAALIDDALASFRADDDPGRDHPVFERDFSVDSTQLRLERDRYAHLRTSDAMVDEMSWFVLPRVRDQLAAALSGSPS